MDGAGFRDCRALPFDFGGTMDANGEHRLDRFVRQQLNDSLRTDARGGRAHGLLRDRE